MDLIIGPEILKSYKRLSYKVWYAFAEFIDNSTQAFVNNENILREVLERERSFLTVKIAVDERNRFIEINDNSIGMDEADLEKALMLGIPPKNTRGRSKYGLGLKTAAFWFGDTWTIVTKKYDSPNQISVRLNIDDIINRIHAKTLQEERKRSQLAKGEVFNEEEIKILDVKVLEVERKLHYTTISIEDLNHKITARTKAKTIDYLRSIYRYDLQNDQLVLFFDETRLSWNKDEFKKRLLKDDLGLPYYKEFSFDVNDKEVTGWAGVLSRGSRKDAGFSLLQSSRVIQGWPEGYKPTKLFGDQEGGINNLTNQRLIGELFLDDFHVSHTKDEILFEGEEEEMLDSKLFKKLIDLKRVAEAFRSGENEAQPKIDFNPIVTEIFQKLQAPKFRALIKEFPVLKHRQIVESNDEVFERALAEQIKDHYSTIISGIEITIIINSEASVYDPYLVVNVRAKQDKLGIVINKNHPHWLELNDINSVFQFLKDCVLDGLAEWKAIRMADSLEPDTIKYIKDSYLREAFTLQ